MMGIDITSLGPKAQAQVYQKLRQREPETKKPPKYHNEPDSRGQVRFDSRKEARRFDELMLLLQAGAIRNLKLQPQYTLQEAYTTTEGVRVRAIRYQADFSYEMKKELGEGGHHDPIGFHEEWWPVVEDVKSAATKTRQYEIKKKLLQERFGVTVKEV